MKCFLVTSQADALTGKRILIPQFKCRGSRRVLEKCAFGAIFGPQGGRIDRRVYETAGNVELDLTDTCFEGAIWDLVDMKWTFPFHKRWGIS